MVINRPHTHLLWYIPARCRLEMYWLCDSSKQMCVCVCEINNMRNSGPTSALAVTTTVLLNIPDPWALCSSELPMTISSTLVRATLSLVISINPVSDKKKIQRKLDSNIAHDGLGLSKIQPINLINQSINHSRAPYQQ